MPADQLWGITRQPGYPSQFIYILGVAKLSGVAVLLTPNKLLRLKVWVIAISMRLSLKLKEREKCW